MNPEQQVDERSSAAPDDTPVDPRRAAFSKVPPRPTRKAAIGPPPPKRSVVLDDEQTPTATLVTPDVPPAPIRVLPEGATLDGAQPPPTQPATDASAAAAPAAAAPSQTKQPPAAPAAQPAPAPAAPAVAVPPAPTPVAPESPPAPPAAPPTAPQSTADGHDASAHDESDADAAEDEPAAPDAKSFGTRKGNLTYIRTSLPRWLSDAFDRAAENTTLGVVLMRAVRNQYRAVEEAVQPEPHDPDDPFPAPRVRIYYRPPGGSINRDIGVAPDEAEAIWKVATGMGLTPSAFMRLALEKEFGHARKPQTPPPPGPETAAEQAPADDAG